MFFEQVNRYFYYKNKHLWSFFLYWALAIFGKYFCQILATQAEQYLLTLQEHLLSHPVFCVSSKCQWLVFCVSRTSVFLFLFLFSPFHSDRCIVNKGRLCFLFFFSVMKICLDCDVPALFHFSHFGIYFHVIQCVVVPRRFNPSILCLNVLIY